MKIALGADHGGYKLKEQIKHYLQRKEIEVIDYGADSPESVDYPDHGFPAAEAVADGQCERGILVCTTGIGMSMVANKVRGVRAALCLNEEMGRLAREHNHANVLVLAAKYTDAAAAARIVDSFLTTVGAGDRHARRVDKINGYRPKV